MSRKGLLLVTMEPAPAAEEEFNAWYDGEHVPERLSVPGFESARRFVCIEGFPKYLALYDLASPGVLDSPAYLRVGGVNSSPWTKRVTSRVRGYYRAAATQLYPGDALTGGGARLLLLRFRGVDAKAEPRILEGMRASFENRRETAQLRFFSAPGTAGVDFLGLVEARAPLKLDLESFGAAADALDLVNTYARY
ncbi:MAG TPA: hypothetical protein VEC75_14900 [Stellaceae bacterium]|nr:hypothetical protein [Stellaceae bacterium]